LQLDKQEEEAALVEIMLQEEIDELTTELSEERNAKRFSELALRGKERDLEEALGCYNEKGEELELLTAQVTSIFSLHPSLPLSLSLYLFLLSLHSSIPLSLSSPIPLFLYMSLPLFLYLSLPFHYTELRPNCPRTL
jgi:hypothetical protein